jgi:UDP-N-acetylmuramate--alanine ligase
VLVLDVYPARETDTVGVNARDLAEEIEHGDVHYKGEIDEAADYLLENAEEDAVIVTLSAGDGNEVGIKVMEELSTAGGR